jgi:hypothetical protein
MVSKEKVTSREHLHDCAPGIPETHMVGSERLSIMADDVIAARSERAVRCAATRDENQVAVCRQNGHPETSALSL